MPLFGSHKKNDNTNTNNDLDDRNNNHSSGQNHASLGGNTRQSQGTGMGMGIGGHTHGQSQGPMIGSNAIQAQGMLKEQELKAFKMQSQELGEAERLEREAMKLRENAVAHGAHPINKSLGAGINDGSSNNL